MKVVKSKRDRHSDLFPSYPLRNWSDGVLVGFDVESTGPDPEVDRIVSASLVIDRPGDESAVREWLIKPEAHPIELQATAVHGISQEYALANGVPAPQGIGSMLRAISRVSHLPMVVVNGCFDFTMLVRECDRYGLDARPVIDSLPIIDTLVIDRYLDMYRAGRRTLTATAAAYGIPIRGAHTASGDVFCAIKLARAIGRKYPSVAKCSLDSLQIVQKSAYQEWADNYQEFQRLETPDFTVDGEWPYRAVAK